MTGTGYGPLTTLASFNGANGAQPIGGLISDAAGDLFGTTTRGGASDVGTVLEIPKTSTGYGTLTTLASFNATNGSGPYASLISDAAGDLFGTTYGGTTNFFGTVFEIPKTSTGYGPLTTLASFNGANGEEPSGLITDAAGDLFGMTSGGGASGDGTVFEILKTSTGYGPLTTLASFNGANGSGPAAGLPIAGLIIDAVGDLFGTTASGGASGDGTVFEIPKTSTGYGTLTTLLSFNGANGAHPTGGLITDAAGDLFGTTSQGGANSSEFGAEITGSGFIVATPQPTVEADRAHVQVAGTVTANAAHGVLAIDTDPIPNDTLIVSAVDGLASDVGHAVAGTYGTLTLNADGSYSYVANQSVPSNIIAQDIFSYTATDGDGGSATSSLTIIITQPGQTYIAGTPGQALTSGNGSVLLDGSLLQNQTIRAGNGIDAVIAGSNDTITLGNGNDVVDAGSSNTISLGNGIDTITAGPDSIITIGNGTDYVTAGSDSTIMLGNGSDTVGAGDGSSITLGNGSNTVIAGTNNVISLGNGANTIYAASGDTITVGIGHDTFVFGLKPGQTAAGIIGPVTINHSTRPMT